jgi:glycosyltransferase involved in cell wall biosynthesis
MTIRVAHISTSRHGGAAVAAQQISSLLSDSGIESTLVSRDNLNSLQHAEISKVSRNLLGKIVTVCQQVNTLQPFGIVTPASISNIDLGKLLQNEYDIIHIHNWYNILNIGDFERISQDIPLVFTLHDERLITGGCHTTLGCEKFINSCTSCPAIRTNKKLVFRSKLQINDFFRQATNVSVISPSQWLKEQFIRAGLAANLRSLVHIPNSISPEYMGHSGYLGNSGTPHKLLFISANINTEIKGLSIFLNALDLLTDELSPTLIPQIELHLVGAGHVPGGKNSNIKIIQHGSKSKAEVRRLMSESTLLIVPSLSENSPNVIGEAQLMGLPVVGSSVGGIPELIEDSVTGFLTPLEPKLMAHNLRRAITSPILSVISARARSAAQVRYDALSIARAHINVYEKAINGV